MVIRDKYQDEDLIGASTNGHSDAPPSYETISAAHGGQSSRTTAYPVPEKLSSQPASLAARNYTPSGAAAGSAPCPVSRPSNPSSWLFKSSFPSSVASEQVGQTILTLIRDLVLNAESPDLLDSCADACRNYRLNLSTLLQERFIEDHSAIYWAILNGRDALLSRLLVHAAPLSESAKSEIYRACLATANQDLFHSLRCWRASSRKEAIPLSSSFGTDMLMLGSTPADEVSIDEVEGQGAFAAKIQINLWQKRMRVVGSLGVEFLARGRIWELSFFASSSQVVGTWLVSLRLLEHSPPTFVTSRLVVDLPPPSSNSTGNAAEANDLISLSPPSSDDPSSIATRPPRPHSPTPSHKSKSKSNAPQSINIWLSSPYRLAYSPSDSVEQWMDDDDITYTSGIVVPLDDGDGAELLYDNTPFVTNDGTLRIRLEARLEKRVERRVRRSTLY